jgi:hypothetical protein
MMAGPFNQLTEEEQNTLVEIMMKMTANLKLHGLRCKE